MAETSYLIKPRPPVRAFAIAAIASLVGAIALVAALSFQWHTFAALLGALLLLAGIALAMLAYVTTNRMSVRLTFDEDGYRVEGHSAAESGRWREVTRVTQSAGGWRVTIHRGSRGRTHLLFATNDMNQLGRVLADLRARLDASQ